MRENTDIRKLGMGSLSLPISLFATIFSFSAIGNKSIGAWILSSVGIRFPYALISIALYILSAFIGYRYKNDRYAKIGANISITLFIICIILTITSEIL